MPFVLKLTRLFVSGIQQNIHLLAPIDRLIPVINAMAFCNNVIIAAGSSKERTSDGRMKVVI